ncbi:MAG: 6-phosphogluconolactonase [Hyphomicrobiaceae bacterium]|nr:6-phosphogluconolactonase [Hyphomicrobiaceae bacterium]
MTSVSEARLEVLADAEALARHVAGWLVAAAVQSDRSFAVALSGGSTPRRLYELLASSPYGDAFPWARTHWFWGDERFVPRHSAVSNYRMVRDAMLSRAPVPPANIHPIPTEGLTPDEAARSYEAELKAFYGASILSADRPLFDVNFLGLGPEGHIASLFPGTAILKERTHWVGTVVGAKPEPRITLTYPALEASREVAFLVTGAAKQAVLRRLLRGDALLPATHLHPSSGRARIFADRGAAPDSQAP